MGKRILTVGILIFVLGASFVLVGRLFSESDSILAKIGDTVVTQGDLDEFLNKYSFMRKGKPYSPEEKKAMLDNLIKGTVVSTEAEREKLDQSPTLKTKLKIYRNELLLQEYIAAKIQPNVSVSDEEIEEIFKQQPLLLQKETLELKEILVKTEKEAEAIYEELKKGGDFSRIAGEKSKADTRITGGLMRPVQRGQLPKAVEDVAFNLKKGELSKPIKTEKGFYILYLVDKKEKTPEEMKKLKEVIKQKIRQIEISKKAQELLEKKAEELKKNTKIEVYYDRIQ